MEEQDVTALHAGGGEASQQSVHPMAELLEQGYGQVLPKRGDAVEGVIVEMTHDGESVLITFTRQGQASRADESLETGQSPG